MLAAVLGYYHARLTDEATGAEGRAYLASRGIGDAGLVRRFALGVADRSLGLRLPVGRENQPARSLYARVGFRPRYEYHYRRQTR